jgi:glutamate racemase
VIERGELDAPATRVLVTRFVTPLLARGVDTIVLGCTHYPFVREVIAAAAGPSVTIVETGAAVARQLERRLIEAGLLTSSVASGRDRLVTTGGARAATTARMLWNEATPVEVLDVELAPPGEGNSPVDPEDPRARRSR